MTEVLWPCSNMCPEDVIFTSKLDLFSILSLQASVYINYYSLQYMYLLLPSLPVLYSTPKEVQPIDGLLLDCIWIPNNYMYYQSMDIYNGHSIEWTSWDQVRSLIYPWPECKQCTFTTCQINLGGSKWQFEQIDENVSWCVRNTSNQGQFGTSKWSSWLILTEQE